MKLRAVLYLRMSSSKQETSVPEQKAVLLKRFGKEYRIVGEYADLGISGDDTAKRKEFRRMMSDAHAGVFDCVLCYDQDRFGRFDSIEAGYWIKPLRDKGVRLITIANGEIDWSDFGGRLIYSVVQEGKHAYLRDLSRNTMRGKLSRAQSGHWVNGKPPYGYTVTETKPRKVLLGDQKEITAVRRVFSEYLAGYSMREVAARMTSAGYPSPMNGHWYASMVKRILTNPIYCGDLVHSRKSSAKYHTIRNGDVSEVDRDGEQGIVVRDVAPPIVSREIFEQVQRKMKDRQTCTTPVKGGGGLVLSKLLVCKNCGSTMYGIRQASNGRLWYVCGGWQAHGPKKCQRRSVRQDVLLDLLKGHILRLVLSEENIDAVTREIERQTAERPDDPKPLIQDLDKKIAAAKKRMVEVDAEFLGVVQEHLRELMRQRESLKSRKQKGERKVRSVRRLFERMVENLSSADPVILREALRELLSRVEIGFEGSEVQRISAYVREITCTGDSQSVYKFDVSGEEYRRKLCA